MPEGLPYFSLESLEWSTYIFSENERELLAFLDDCEHGPRSEELWDQPGEWRLRQAALEVSRLLHNYVAAAASLLEHLDKIHRKLFATREFAEYSSERKKQVLDDPLVQFVKELRNIALHQGDSSISFASSSARPGGPVKCAVSLSKPYLEDVRRWRVPAKTYLEAAPRSIGIGALVEVYGRHVREFCDWYRGRTLDIWGLEYQRHREAMQEYLRVRVEVHADEWLANPTRRCPQIEFLRRLIDDRELSTLQQMPDGTQERVECAIALMRSHLLIAEPLADKLREAFAVPGFNL